MPDLSADALPPQNQPIIDLDQHFGELISAGSRVGCAFVTLLVTPVVRHQLAAATLQYAQRLHLWLDQTPSDVETFWAHRAALSVPALPQPAEAQAADRVHILDPAALAALLRTEPATARAVLGLLSPDQRQREAMALAAFLQRTGVSVSAPDLLAAWEDRQCQ